MPAPDTCTAFQKLRHKPRQSQKHFQFLPSCTFYFGNVLFIYLSVPCRYVPTANVQHQHTICSNLSLRSFSDQLSYVLSRLPVNMLLLCCRGANLSRLLFMQDHHVVVVSGRFTIRPNGNRCLKCRVFEGYGWLSVLLGHNLC